MIKESEPKGCLDGLKVLDFTWAVAGPLTTKYLADFGATVVKVESSTRPDVMRVGSPYKDNVPGLDRSGMYIIFNSNKYGITLNLNSSRGRDVARKLVRWCDVVAENFKPGVMEKWGLGYQDLKKIKPDVVMLRSSMEGMGGPRVKRRLTGHQGVGLAGFTYLTGFPDLDPTQPFGAYTDYIGPKFMAAALMAALDYRRRTGKGQCLELSQYEASLHFLAPAILDFSVNGRQAERAGNSCPHAAPHAAYSCQGNDRWCAISVFTEVEWHALCTAIDRPELIDDPRFSTVIGRKANEEQLDRIIEEWCLRLPAEEVMALLQAAGVAAGVVRSMADLHDDPQTWEHGHLWQIDRPETGPVVHLGQGFRLTDTPARARNASPTIGQDTEHVMTSILGMGEDEFVELMNEGVFE